MSAPILCYVTDRKLPAPAAGVATDPLGALLECVERAARAGVDWIQLREKDLDGRVLFDLTAGAMAASSAATGGGEKRTRIVVNDRLDVAWAAGAGGVHLGEDSLPVAEVVRWRNGVRREDFLVGVSCHSLERAAEAAGAGTDYIFFGPVFATPSKAAFGAPQGLRKLGEVCRAVSVPVLAIGGITAENARDCLGAGAAGIAAIRLFQQTQELAGVLRKIQA
jgi:thiamine-phosphate pyrophosphorylase